MLYRQCQPAPPLSLFVQALWYTKGFDLPHRRERVLPNGTIQLVISLAYDHTVDCSREPGRPDVTMGPSVIAGMQSEYLVIDTMDLVEMIGVQFWPGGFVPFFGIPADEFSHRQISLEDVWGAEARTLRDRLREARQIEAKFRLLEHALLSRAKLARHPAVDFALQEFRSSYRSVAEVTRQVGLSPRRFAQVFREQVGVTPKLYCRILRFQRAVRHMNEGREIDWASLALDCGYFDQAHFVNDFRAFSGITPTSYLAGRSRWMNHVAINP